MNTSKVAWILVKISQQPISNKTIRNIFSDKNFKFKISWFNLEIIYLYIFHNSNNREIKINLAYLHAFILQCFPVY